MRPAGLFIMTKLCALFLVTFMLGVNGTSRVFAFQVVLIVSLDGALVTPFVARRILFVFPQRASAADAVGAQRTSPDKAPLQQEYLDSALSNSSKGSTRNAEARAIMTRIPENVFCYFCGDTTVGLAVQCAHIFPHSANPVVHCARRCRLPVESRTGMQFVPFAL